MLTQEAAEALRDRCRRPRATNLIYLRWPVRYTAQDPAREVAALAGATVLSIMETLVQRHGAHWERLLRAERERSLDVAARALEEDLLRRLREAPGDALPGGAVPCVVLVDSECLYALPQVNLTGLLYPESMALVIAVSLKAAPVQGGLRLLEDGPVYPTYNATVWNMQ